MKYLLIIMICFSCGTKGSKQPTVTNAETPAVITINNNKPDTIQPATTSPLTLGNTVALYFGSMASGPIADDFLKAWLLKFMKDEKVSITADKFSGCGKEGEYIIVINKKKLNSATENKFKAALQQLISEEVNKNKATNPSSGPVEIRQNPNMEDYTYCRGGSKKWL